MAEIIYENEAAVLSFKYEDVIDSLKKQINKDKVEDDSLLLSWLKENSTDGDKDININYEYEGEDYLTRISYVIKNLLSDKKGKIYCKKCGLNISPLKIKKEQHSPFDYYKGIDKKSIKKVKKELGIKSRMRLPGGSGGTKFFCDKGHELFGTRDWMI
jgi:hypothetical protein